MEPLIVDARECPYCHQFWPDTAKYFEPRYKKCRACRCEDNRQWRRANPEKKREQDRQYRQANSERIREYQHRWYQANREKSDAKSRLWQQTHPERRREHRLKWIRANAEKDRERRKKYRADNRERYREHCRRARIKIRATETDVTPEKILALKAHSKICYWCKKKMKPDEMSVDHITPISKGGPHLMWNIVICHQKCNSRKCDKHPQTLGVLF